MWYDTPDMDRATVCELALQKVGKFEYVSGTPGYEVCRSQFPLLYREMLQMGDWCFARRCVQLAAGVNGEYELPPDCLRIVKLEGLSNWYRYGRCVRPASDCWYEGTVWLTYTSSSLANRGEVPDNEAPIFVQALITLLGSRLAVPVANDRQLCVSLEQQGQALLMQALALDVQQDSSNDQHPLNRILKQSVTEAW